MLCTYPDNLWCNMAFLYMQYAGHDALWENYDGKSHVIHIRGEGYSKGSHGHEKNQHKAASVAHTREKNQEAWHCCKPRMCSPRKRRRCLRMVCANSNLIFIMLANCRKNPHEREYERIEIPWLSCPYATSVVSLCTFNHEKRGSNMNNKIESDIQTLMRQNHQSIGHERTTRRYGHHLVHAQKINFTSTFGCHDAPFGAFGWRTRYLWASTHPLDVSYEMVSKNIEGLCS